MSGQRSGLRSGLGSRLGTGLLRPMAAVALAAALVVTTPGAVEAASGAAAAGAGTDVAPTPVGRATSSGSSAPSGGSPRTVRAQVVVNVTCRAAEAFSRTGDGALYRLVDSAPSSNTADTMTESSQVGSGWSGSSMAWTVAGGDGVLYALTWNGDLKWYRYNTGTSGWMTGSGRTIGTGFTPRSKVLNIALGGDGYFYLVRANGQLVVFRHTGRLTGAASWANRGGWVIGSGWTGDELLIPNGGGVLYRQHAGTLYWYKHTDPGAGPVTWSRRRTIGSGWRFYDVLSAGAGVLYATVGVSGDVMVFRHGDPAGGGSSWATSRGVRKATVRPNSYGVAVDPIACSVV